MLENIRLLLDPTHPLPAHTSCAECGKPLSYAIRYRLCNNCLVPLTVRLERGAVMRKHRPGNDDKAPVAKKTTRRKTTKKV